ncbi:BIFUNCTIONAL INHIBITOR/LIPID-TRANSFER PROTEIN/SEED STORAGE 2S ALBUMIN SUPERFAMILY PROTEIN [Salix viminalis]|uniref:BIFUNCTIONAL INHIBITOR/LIPID-TRANSFER PROTEIN/SEED STORAGE 2S ALBUMIN SUPERFAMILY PROTEIN n=1 Tax=Salix viminalis TaxID=40686 RepID=A0A9Q0U155_SALVM|nr:BIFUNCTIONAL INHIBITOR/LIPID-TRANSFER PROTEIN/SEED STORAGE 2S ALBUMIN SUPERFAMILY PROTEIN [Salix viminalis]
MTTIIFPAVLTSMLLLLATAAPSPASAPGCSDELVAFSPCLGYVSAPPNRETDTATSQCCDAFSKGFNSSAGNCFCYLIKQPLIFGFPLDESRVIALTSVCSLSSLVSLDSLCSGSPALPPLRGPTAPMPGPGDLQQLAPSLPPESVDGSPTSPVSPLAPRSHSSAEKHNSNGWFLPGVLTSIIIFNLYC